jgi:PIN domain nuclease of toxin-antitoxin system
VATGRYYVDTSAYLCVLLGEAGGERLARELRGGHLLSSTLLALEAERTLVQLSRAGRLSPEDVQSAVEQLGQDLSQFVLRDLTLDLCRSRVMPIVSTPRSLDLAHLRTALWFHEREPLSRFVSLDTAQTQAARELGLPL